MSKAPRPSLRRATRDDISWIVARHAELYRASDGFDDTFAGFVERVAKRYFADENPAYERGWIAMRETAAIGAIFCDATSERDTARIRMFFVEPDVRGLGFGTTLLETCIQFATNCGYRRLGLWTHESHSAACRLYEKHGFQKHDAVVAYSFGVPMIEVSYSRPLP